MTKRINPGTDTDRPEMEEFTSAIQAEADRQVEEMVEIGTAILDQVPERVMERLKSFRHDWTRISTYLATAPNTGGDSL